MAPTIGRIVHLRVAPDGDVEAPFAPAVIVRVWSDTCVNLRVFMDDNETPALVTSVVEGDELGDWRWPPRV